MEYYQEITLHASAELPLNFILSKVYMQLHLAFVAVKDGKDRVTYGVSFPEYSEIGLGKKIRVFGETRADMETLSVENALSRLLDYVHITQIRPVPARRQTGYAVYSRYHQENSNGQKIRRYARRHDVNLEEAAKVMNIVGPARKTLPYVQLKSLTNKHKFSLFIRRDSKKQEGKGNFSVYGLSMASTVPEF
jgi:CRISPR-associated endonuclease Csy4